MANDSKARSETGMNKSSLEELLSSVFAPWVQALNLTIEAVDGDKVSVRMTFDEQLCRKGGIVCGQSLMAISDTAMVLAVCAASGTYRPMGTVDQTTHFMRPASKKDVIAEASVTRLGRTMAFAQTTLFADGDERPVAIATAAYALAPA
jgi:uncharacterized protein (TIGR00369 family)